ncbi:TonB-dependent receptor [Tenacibaculum caenipelagi]|uniref:Iron complex outermembrane receptor protein n=1 Tax=Tenacibaculum caenipelagi TaxID=1325435 RepID=A0A4R6TFG3_9FLAO|nr:TonB-dependent receptor [Tenacibaculum caenipelagi]TDQ25812.1 iron complex outermembrane receptor protein [Tenacibaculum caenipelagi]
MKKLINFLLFLGVTAVAAQNSLSGKITDTNNQPLIGVEIYSEQLHKGTISNNDGTYTLQNIPNGEVTITFTFLGFKNVSKRFTFNQNSITFNLELEESVFKIDEVIISTPFNKLQSENVMKVERLSAKAIQKTGATTLSEGITNIAGVSQISTGASIGKPVIRGLSGNRVLVYTQGIRLENQQFGGEHGLGINDAGIQGIEVIKGPASLLYGSDALGGVLYIQPEKFAPENTTKVNVNQRYFSNTLGTNASVGLKSSLKNWQFLARGTYAQHADYKTPSYRVTNTRFKEKDLKLGVGFHEKNFSSELRYNFNNSKLGLTEGIGEQTKETHFETPYQDINNHIISLHNHVFFKNSKLDIDLGYTINNRKEFEEHHDHEAGETEEEHEEHEEGEAALNMKLKTFSYNTKYHLPKFGKFEVLLGAQGLHQTNTNFGEELLIPNATVNDFGVFTTANYDLNDYTSLQAGIRYDNRAITTERHEIVHEDEIHVFEAIDKSFNSFTASFGFKTKLFKILTTRVNIANGFRAPNLAELTSNGVHHGTNRFEMGNNNLVNEKNLQFDLSIDYNSEHFELFANGFYNKLSNYIYLSPTGEIEDEAPVYTYLQEDAKLYGGEFGFHLHPHPLDWLHLQSSFETVIGKQSNGNYLPLIPANALKNTLRTEFSNNKWLHQGYASVSLHSFFKQDNVSEFETSTPAYNLVNLGVGGDIQISKYTFTTSLAINNLFDKKYINHLSRLKSDNIMNAGRNIVIGIEFTL